MSQCEKNKNKCVSTDRLSGEFSLTLLAANGRMDLTAEKPLTSVGIG